METLGAGRILTPKHPIVTMYYWIGVAYSYLGLHVGSWSVGFGLVFGSLFLNLITFSLSDSPARILTKLLYIQQLLLKYVTTAMSNTG